VFQSSYFADMSLDTSMALTPPQLVEAHLELEAATVKIRSVRHFEAARVSSFESEFSFVKRNLMALSVWPPIFTASASALDVEAQEMTMKKLITAAALATVLASPALAQSYDPDIGSGNIAPPVYAQAPRSAYDAFASVPDNGLGASARVNHGSVMPDGAAARDPDPNIQFQLNREAEEGEW
jgi:hypothetical protein